MNAANPTLEALGFEVGARVAIVHADDVGMCHGANQAFIELSRRGAVTSGSVMVPCPWFRDLAERAVAEPSVDLGIHLTLTSEWAGYRWGPISTVSPSSGLIDDDGCFWRTLALLAEHVVPEAAEIEFHAQIERALAAGIDATHLDTHMGVAVIPALLDTYVRLGREYRLPVLAPRHPEEYFNVLRMDMGDASPYNACVAGLERRGVPLVDDFRLTPGVPTEDSDAVYRHLAQTVPEGLTFIALHPNVPGDIEAIIPPRAHFRTDEYRLLSEGRFTGWLEEGGVRTIGYRPLRDLMRADT